MKWLSIELQCGYVTGYLLFISLQKLPKSKKSQQINSKINQLKRFLTSPSVPIQRDEHHNVLRDNHDPSVSQSNEGGALLPLCTYLRRGWLFFDNRSRHILRGNSESINESLADVIEGKERLTQVITKATAWSGTVFSKSWGKRAARQSFSV
jgi:hypothetical protein